MLSTAISGVTAPSPICFANDVSVTPCFRSAAAVAARGQQGVWQKIEQEPEESFEAAFLGEAAEVSQERISG